jgi:hypothetical protein
MSHGHRSHRRREQEHVGVHGVLEAATLRPGVVEGGDRQLEQIRAADGPERLVHHDPEAVQRPVLAQQILAAGLAAADGDREQVGGELTGGVHARQPMRRLTQRWRRSS